MFVCHLQDPRGDLGRQGLAGDRSIGASRTDLGTMMELLVAAVVFLATDRCGTLLARMSFWTRPGSPIPPVPPREKSMVLYVDGDACPVKEEVYRVARRHDVKVLVVANATMRVPTEDLIELVVVRGGFDAADDWIADHVGPGDVVVTADIPLAGRCLERVRGCSGTRAMCSPRTRSARRWRPAPCSICCGSRARSPAARRPSPRRIGRGFLSKLDEILHAVRREKG